MGFVRRVREWFWNVLVALDELVNAVTGGDPDATVSLRIAQAAGRGSRLAKLGCRILDLLHPGHCESVLQGEEAQESR